MVTQLSNFKDEIKHSRNLQEWANMIKADSEDAIQFCKVMLDMASMYESDEDSKNRPRDWHRRLFDRFKQGSYMKKYDVSGFRYFKMLVEDEALMQPVRDPGLKEMFNIDKNQGINKVELWHRSWADFIHQRQILTERGTYAHDFMPGFKEGLGKLIALRIHPETQSFYKYLSPSGYVNDMEPAVMG
jgi:hypothetical protein